MAPRLPSRRPGGCSIDVPPWASAASWNCRTCSGDLHLKPMVPPLAKVAVSPLIGSLTQNAERLARSENR